MNDKIKTSHEKASCTRFLNLYNQNCQKEICFIKLGDPQKKEPDCLCTNNIAIEIVGTYSSKSQAKQIWDSARGKTKGMSSSSKLITLENLEENIAKKLNKLNKENYEGIDGKIILLCNLHIPCVSDSEIETFSEEYMPFKNDQFFSKFFDEIWITWHSEEDGNWKIQRLE